MSIQLQSPVPLVTLVKTEPLTVIKNEPSEEVLEEEISTDIKDIDFVYHQLGEDLIKSETVLENILENKHLASVQTQALIKVENSSFIKTENITQRIKSEDTSDRNVSRATDQGVIEIQASNEHSNALSKLDTDEKSVLNFSKDLNIISVRSRKSKSPKKTDFAECYKTDETTLWEKEKEKIKVIKAPRIHIKSHEYTSLAEDNHVCNHCQHSSKSLKVLKMHITRIHRKDITMYQCPYCPFKSYYSLYNHIIAKHKSAEDIQWFQCHLCENKFKLKCGLIKHMRVHLTHKQMQDRLALREKRYYCEICALLCSTYSQFKLHKLTHKTKADMDDQDLKYRCNKCNYKAVRRQYLISHKLIHLKSEEIQYFYCYHCSYKAKRRESLKGHIFNHFRNGDVPFHCYICDFVTPKRNLIIEHIRKHSKNRNKYDETISKYRLESRINKLEKRYRCDQCDYITYEKAYLKKHKLNHLKPDEIQYFHCYHCSYKSKYKGGLTGHISTHFRKGDVPFYCHICDFTTSKRDVIIKHFKTHPEYRSKCDESIRKYQLETHTKKREKRYSCEKCNYKTYSRPNLTTHRITHLKPEEIKYFHCYHCSYKSKHKCHLKTHIVRHFEKEEVKFYCYICDFMTLERDAIVKHVKKHSKLHNKI